MEIKDLVYSLVTLVVGILAYFFKKEASESKEISKKVEKNTLDIAVLCRENSLNQTHIDQRFDRLEQLIREHNDQRKNPPNEKF